MPLFSKLNKLITGQQQPAVASPRDERSATRPMQGRHPHDEATRPSYRIRDEKWLRIQKAIDQAG